MVDQIAAAGYLHSGHVERIDLEMRQCPDRAGLMTAAIVM